MQVEAMQAERDHPHDTWVIFEPEAEIGFMYTSGLAAVAASNIELIALDVQRHSVPSFSNCFNFLGSRLEEGHAILPGQKVMREAGTTQDYMNMIVGVDESTNRYLLDNYALQVGPVTVSVGKYTVKVGDDVNLLLVVPIERLPFTLSNGAIVGERELRIESIKNKFARERNQFIRHINGNTLDNNIHNLASVNAYDALVHVNDWTTDWACYVTEEEAQFVRDNIETFMALYQCLAPQNIA